MNFDAYRTIAEISVTLTGFIGVVLVLQHRDQSFMRLFLGTILGAALGAMMFSFLPDFLGNLFSPDNVRRVACGSFGAYHLYLISNHQAKQRSIRSNTPVQLAITRIM